MGPVRVSLFLSKHHLLKISDAEVMIGDGVFTQRSGMGSSEETGLVSSEGAHDLLS